MLAFVFLFLVLKKSSKALNHSSTEIDFFRTISPNNVRGKQRRLSLNGIAKEKPEVFSLQ